MSAAALAFKGLRIDAFCVVRLDLWGNIGMTQPRHNRLAEKK